HRHAVVIEQLVDSPEESSVVVYADVLEHADRHDAVERARHLAVILQREFYDGGEPLLARTLLRDSELLGAERHSLHSAAGVGREPEPQSAPARANVENSMARAQRHLGGEMHLFGMLGTSKIDTGQELGT